jgi:pyruvate formate lyase activating enzyme
MSGTPVARLPKANNMSTEHPSSPTPLEGKSPFELRLNQSRGVSDSAVRKAIETGDMGFVHSFTTGSTVDGPGVRLVAWTAGCQWRCLYCHNPDTWNLMNGMPVTLERAADELRKYRHGLKLMSGGLTLSGGEPLMQDRFAVKLFTAAQTMGIHTTVETNGFLGERLTDGELEKIDLVMLGIKTWGPEKHRHLTGRDIEPTLDFARRLAARKRPMWVRFVLVPGLTDDPQDIREIAKFAAGLGNVERVEVLPFHQMGRHKWEKLGIKYELNETGPPSNTLLDLALGLFQAEGLKAF